MKEKTCILRIQVLFTINETSKSHTHTHTHIYNTENHTDFGNKSHRNMNLQQTFKAKYKNRKNRDNCEVMVNLNK